MASIREVYNKNGTIIVLIDDVLSQLELICLTNWLKEQEYRGENCYKNTSLDRKQLWFHKELKPFCAQWKKPNKRWESQEYTPILSQTQDRVLNVTQACSDFYGFGWNLENHNSCLINKYEDGTKYIPPHRDTPLSFGEEPVIVGYSVGQHRKLRLENETETMEFELTNNSIFVMAGRSQTDFKHSIPLDEELKDVRYSMTFRYHSNF